MLIRPFALLLAGFCLFTFPPQLQAQSCSACDVTVNSSTDIEITASDQVICITGSFTYTNQIDFNFNNTTVCIDDGVTFNPSVQTELGDITYDLYGTWTNPGNISSQLTINNYGTVSSFGPLSGTFNHFSTTPISLSGGLSIIGNGVLFIDTVSTLIANGSSTNSGSLNVQGSLQINGSFGNNSDAEGLSIGVSGSINVTGNVTNDSDMNIDGDLSMGGNFNNNANGSISNQGSIGVGGAYTNAGTVCSLTCGFISVGGSFQNNASAGVAFNGADCGEIILCIGGAETNNGTYGTGLSIDCTASCLLLPVRLTYFNAYPEEKYVTLKWKTAMEEENSFFAVERSPEGFHFEELVRLEGGGTRDTPTAYQWSDPLPLSSAYYRLRQEDTDGSTTYSPVVYAVLFKSQGMELLSPIPVSDKTLWLRLPAQGKGEVHLSLHNAKGQKVAESWLPASRDIRWENLPDLNGLFFLNCTYGQESRSFKIVFE